MLFICEGFKRTELGSYWPKRRENPFIFTPFYQSDLRVDSAKVYQFSRFSALLKVT